MNPSFYRALSLLLLLTLFVPLTSHAAVIDDVKGKILLQVESHGEAWYVDPETEERYYLPSGEVASLAFSLFGLGISNTDIKKIPIGLDTRFELEDSDGDGLGDVLEDAIGTDDGQADSDGDGFSDGTEVTNGFDPMGSGPTTLNTSLANHLKGRILLQVESHGEAWYVNPTDGKRYYLNTGEAAYEIMKYVSLGITNDNLITIPIGVLRSLIATSCDDLTCAKTAITNGQSVIYPSTLKIEMESLTGYTITEEMVWDASMIRTNHATYPFFWNVALDEINFSSTNPENQDADSIFKTFVEKLKGKIEENPPTMGCLAQSADRLASAMEGFATTYNSLTAIDDMGDLMESLEEQEDLVCYSTVL